MAIPVPGSGGMNKHVTVTLTLCELRSLAEAASHSPIHEYGDIVERKALCRACDKLQEILTRKEKHVQTA